LAGELAHIPVVATAHGFTDVSRSVSLYEKLDRWVLRHKFKRVAVVTDRMLNGFPAEKKRLIPNGIDTERFKRDASKGKALRAQFGIKNNDMLIGTVGRLSREKNQKMLIEAAKTLIDGNDRFKFLIVGNGPEDVALQKLVQAYRLSDHVIFTGLVSDLVPVYSAMDVFVLCSLTEGVPLTVLEAMATRLPVVATRVGGVPEIITDDETGLLIESSDMDALKSAISGLMQDQYKRIRMGESARRFVQANYSLEKMCEEYRNVYKEALNATKEVSHV